MHLPVHCTEIARTGSLLVLASLCLPTTVLAPPDETSEASALGIPTEGFDSRPGGIGKNQGTTRDVRFLATADPQVQQITSDSSRIQRATTEDMMYKLNSILNTGRYRGLVIAGDLTQFTYTDEFQPYQRMRGDLLNVYYEGYGNHDLYDVWINNQRPEDVKNDVLRTNRSQITLSANGAALEPVPIYTLANLPHYSWDWGGVHFVQLNLYPGWAPGSENANRDPANSMAFLVNDLAVNVMLEDPNKPVVLIHHYCMPDSFDICGWTSEEKGWWTLQEKLNYWNILASYNVIAIITGHLHLPFESDSYDFSWKKKWDKPQGAIAGPAYIPAFIVGAAKNERYAQFHITDDSMTVEYDSPAYDSVNTSPAFSDCIAYAFDSNDRIDRTNRGISCTYSADYQRVQLGTVTFGGDPDEIEIYSTSYVGRENTDDVTVCLLNSGTSGWWKGIGFGQHDPTIGGNDLDGIQCGIVEAKNTVLTFWKAKPAHVSMDNPSLPTLDLTPYAGTVVTFKWTKD